MSEQSEQSTIKPIAILDLSGSITRDQFEDAVKDAHNHVENVIRPRRGWCTERYRYYACTIPGYVFDNWAETGQLDLSTVPHEDGLDYASMLRDMRGKILWYVNSGVITLDEANDIFRAAGLPEYHGKDRKDGIRLRVGLSAFNINVAADETRDARAWVRDNFRDFLTRMIDGKPPQDDDKYVPGSIVIPDHYIEVTHAPERFMIDEADTVRPSYS